MHPTAQSSKNCEMLIGELCRRTGTSKGAIRHYESLGLIISKPRQAGSRIYREFEEDAIRRLEIIKNGKKFGFKLAEGRDILEALVNNKLSVKQRKEILEGRLNDIDRQILELQTVRKEIESKIKSL